MAGRKRQHAMQCDEIVRQRDEVAQQNNKKIT